LKEHVGIKIKKIRLRNKDTLKGLAEKVDYNYSNLSKVERGLYRASLDLIKKLSEVYDINPSYFLDEDFTESEGRLLVEDDLSPSNLLEKYDFTIDGTEATEEEIMEAVKLIRYLRNK
jgi:transcriptional regulator with XRE-family HTH domain